MKDGTGSPAKIAPSLSSQGQSSFSVLGKSNRIDPYFLITRVRMVIHRFSSKLTRFRRISFPHSASTLKATFRIEILTLIKAQQALGTKANFDGPLL